MSIELNDYTPKYYDYTNARVVAFDIETYDPNIKKLGAGVYRDDSYILGCALSDETGKTDYYDFRDNQKNFDYVKNVLALRIPKISHNSLYDRDFLENQGVKINGVLHDTLVADWLLDEYKPHTLESTLKKFMDEGKSDALGAFGGIKNIAFMPISVVAEYAKKDVVLLPNLLKKQWAQLAREGLKDVYNLEIELLDLVLLMRKTGVRINVDLLDKHIIDIRKVLFPIQLDFTLKHGVNYNSSQQLSTKMDALGIPYPKTEKGNPHIDKDLIKELSLKIGPDFGIFRELQIIKNQEKLLGTLENLRKSICSDGRVHCTFNPHGTISGRFSSKQPNLQNVPKRDENACRMLRGLFIPDAGMSWLCLDQSQVEYRLIAHFAIGPGADKIRELYNTDPTTDYHRYISDLTGFDRGWAKNLNFAAAYFLGEKSCCKKFGWSMEEAKKFFNTYFTHVPFLEGTRNGIVNEAKAQGYVRSISGRKHRLSQYHRERGKEYSLFNRKIQGSAADLFKAGMVQSDKAGLFNVLSPHLQVHDEIDLSYPDTKEGLEACRELQHIFENAITLNVPVIAKMEKGPNWFELGKF